MPTQITAYGKILNAKARFKHNQLIQNISGISLIIVIGHRLGNTTSRLNNPYTLLPINILLSLVLLVVSNFSLVIVSTKHLTIRPRNTLAVLPGLARLPLLGLASNTDFIVQLINLLKGQTLGLVDEEVNESNTQETAAEPDEEDFGLEVGLSRAVIDEVGSRISCNVLVA